MAKAPETDSPKRKSKGANIVVWTLMVLLIAGLGGFGVTNYGSGVSAIGSVGDRPIKMTDYARALRAETTSMSGQVGKPLTVHLTAISNKAQYMAQAQAIQGYLNQAGFKADLQGLASPAWLAANTAGTSTLTPSQYIGVDPDATAAVIPASTSAATTRRSTSPRTDRKLPKLT